MALIMDADFDEVCTPTVKNTFIDLQLLPAHAPPRRKSVPASLRLCANDFAKTDVDIDASTDAHTDASTDGGDGSGSEFAVSTPRSCYEDYCAEQPAQVLECVPCGPAPTWARTPLRPPKQRLNANANAFKPQTVGEEPAKPHFKRHIADVITLATQALQRCEHAAHVEISESNGVWSIVVQAREKGDWQTERLLTVAKEALLDATSQSKSIYVMGFCAPKPFTMRPQGFEATLGAMENATTACWHVFKKGFCRHSANCNKEHPVCEVPVHVLVECAQLNSSVSFVREFQHEVADLVMSVTSTFKESSYVEGVAAFKDKDDESWTVEVTAKQEGPEHKEYLLAIAKNTLFSASNGSKHVYIMGYAAKPFVPKANGFVVMVGDMQDETKACWNLYTKGVCHMDCACRWEHPECLMPINIVIKSRVLT